MMQRPPKETTARYHHQYHYTTSKGAGLMEYSRRVTNRMEIPQGVYFTTFGKVRPH